jgi:REP element-mobilizing transposase RayT
MPRPPRICFPGALYHVTARGVDRMAIYRDNVDRRLFLTLLGLVVNGTGWQVYAYCLMGNHYHLLMETPEPNVSEGMQYLNGVYGQRFNRRHERTGHLLGGRFHSVLVQKHSHLLEAARYVVLNPVRAGLRRHPADWPWSSYCATAGTTPPPQFLDASRLLASLHSDPRRARPAYRRFVEVGMAIPPDATLALLRASDAAIRARATQPRAAAA